MLFVEKEQVFTLVEFFNNSKKKMLDIATVVV